MSKQQEDKEDIEMTQLTQMGQGQIRQIQILRAHFCGLQTLTISVFERLGRYETSLWRQTAQILLLLSSIEFRAKDHFPDERPHFRRVRQKARTVSAVWVRSVLEICWSVAIAMENSRLERRAG